MTHDEVKAFKALGAVLAKEMIKDLERPEMAEAAEFAKTEIIQKCQDRFRGNTAQAYFACMLAVESYECMVGASILDEDWESQRPHLEVVK